MKKITLGLLSLVSFGAFAQAPLNPGFEFWETDTINATTFASNPVDWNTSNNLLLQFPGGSINVTQDTANEHSGTSAAKLRTLDLVLFKASGLLTTGDIAYANNSFVVSGGQPYTSRPGVLTGWYKYVPGGVDSCMIYAFLTKWNGSSRDTVASTMWVQSATVNAYESFASPFAYASVDNPDTLLIVALSSAGVTSGATNSTLWLDDVNLEFSASVENPNTDATLHLYPNPVQSKLNFSGNAGQYTTANVFDMTGRLVSTFTVSGNSVDVSSLNPGQYIVEMRGTGQTIRSAIAKQ
jgi:hypothetical protein